MEFRKVLTSRRSHREFSGAAIAPEQLREILRAALFAPNHKRNEPWRFTVVEHVSLAKFWNALAPKFSEALSGRTPEEIEQKRAKLAAKIPTMGAIVHVTVLSDANPTRERENYAATCCAVQNMLLQATDLGLGSFWSTGEIFASSACAALLGVPAGEKFVGSIWFGHALDSPPPPVYELAPRVRYWA